MEVRSQIMFNIFSGETVDELYIALPNQVCSFEVVPLILCLLPAQSSLSCLKMDGQKIAFSKGYVRWFGDTVSCHAETPSVF